MQIAVFSVYRNADSECRLVRNYLTEKAIMKSFWCFIRDANSVDPNLVVYKVKVGSSERERVRLALLESYCVDTGAFFRPVDEDTDFFLLQKASSVFPHEKLGVAMFRSCSISISELYRMIIDDSLDAFENSLCMPRAYFYQLSTLSRIFFNPSFYKSDSSICKPEPRKYLSREGRVSLASVAISCACIVFLFLLAGFLEGIERTLY